MAEVKTPEWKGISTDLTSFNAYGVLTLSDGQRVNVQMTMRHGMKAEKLYEDFKEFHKFLDLAGQDSSVKFWDGSKGEAKTSELPKSSGNGEGTYDNPKSFTPSRLIVQYDKGKIYHKIEGLEGKFPKFPVSVWPEVLEAAGIDGEKVDPKDGYPLAGWTAYYIVNEKGNPAKVIRLENPDAEVAFP